MPLSLLLYCEILRTSDYGLDYVIAACDLRALVKLFLILFIGDSRAMLRLSIYTLWKFVWSNRCFPLAKLRFRVFVLFVLSTLIVFFSWYGGKTCSSMSDLSSRFLLRTMVEKFASFFRLFIRIIGAPVRPSPILAGVVWLMTEVSAGLLIFIISALGTTRVFAYFLLKTAGTSYDGDIFYPPNTDYYF